MLESDEGNRLGAPIPSPSYGHLPFDELESPSSWFLDDENLKKKKMKKNKDDWLGFCVEAQLRF